MAVDVYEDDCELVNITHTNANKIFSGPEIHTSTPSSMRQCNLPAAIFRSQLVNSNSVKLFFAPPVCLLQSKFDLKSTQFGPNFIVQPAVRPLKFGTFGGYQ
ncbi:uncharacterized protein EAE98_003810 [Botrytis deweyae]|uniref:Uncharacterized protein n=1 Tax=Botrytis deweyae TaxID=2478750 RepID=A0ABQ7IRS0_9HELO|nr:uncharacterized protein EAE98_003810 [Botrytis deweyae]KAF7932511.1 hypothetical protein EAE98_003810 [Botrytis deweyae]KAF7939646.1 hypothetical protein EAE99_001451 [Botrytis elliptica]